MTVTKQQQLEWLAEKYKSWPEQGATSLGLSVSEIGKFAIVNSYVITRKEWQQERDKMQKQAEQPSQDSSWHDRGELPPVGCECSAVCDGQWVTVEVLRHRVNNAGMNVAAVMSCASFNVFWATDFRPLRTEREKAIDEIVNALIGGDDRSAIQSAAVHTAELIYDAGYRKVSQ